MVMSPPVAVPAACPLPATSTTALFVVSVVEMFSLTVRLPVAVIRMAPVAVMPAGLTVPTASAALLTKVSDPVTLAAIVPTLLLLASSVTLLAFVSARLVAEMLPLPMSVTVPVLSRITVLPLTALKAPVSSIPPVVFCKVSESLTVVAPTVILPLCVLRPTVIPEKPATKLVLK